MSKTWILNVYLALQAKMKQIWTTLKEFGGVELKQLTGGGINHPRNIMTLTET